MAETHATGFDDPVNRATAQTAAKAVPQVLGWRDHQGRGFISMEGADAGEVFAALLEHHARGLDQTLYRHFVF